MLVETLARPERAGVTQPGQAADPAGGARRADPHPRRPAQPRRAGRGLGRRRGHHSPALHRRRVDCRRAVGDDAARGHARSQAGQGAGRFAGPGGGAEPHRADGAHGAQGLRQLHVHPHGERVDPGDGAGAQPRHRRHAAARVRPGGADARHRQGAHAARGAEQARQAHRRRVRDHADARRGRRRDPAPHARTSRRWRRSWRSSTTCGSTAPAIRWA